jgi:hypothetical protein
MFIWNERGSSKQLDFQNLSLCCTTIFDIWIVYHVYPIRVASRGYMHAPRPFIISSRHTISVWVLLRLIC